MKLIYDFGSYELSRRELCSAVKDLLNDNFSKADLIELIIDMCEDEVLFDYFEDDLLDMFEENVKNDIDDYDDLNSEYIRNKIGV